MSSRLPDARLGTRTYRIEAPHLGTEAVALEDRPRYSERDVAVLLRDAERRIQAECGAVFEARAVAFDEECGRVLRALIAGSELLRKESAVLGQEAARGAVRLACAIARRLLRAELSRPERSIAPLIEELLPRLGPVDKISIRLCPRDDQALSGQEGLETARQRGVRFVADETIEPGGCRVETERGTWDASVASQLSRIQDALEETLAFPGEQAVDDATEAAA